MRLVTYSPWQVFDDLHSNIDRLFQQRLRCPEGDESSAVTSHWRPSVDIKEEADRFVLYADIPGVDPKDIQVTMEKGILTVKGERSTETKEEGQQFSRLERSHGMFERRFVLPESADAEKVEARGKHGVLEVSVPKRPDNKPRRIPIAA